VDEGSEGRESLGIGEDDQELLLAVTLRLFALKAATEPAAPGKPLQSC